MMGLHTPVGGPCYIADLSASGPDLTVTTSGIMAAQGCAVWGIAQGLNKMSCQEASQDTLSSPGDARTAEPNGRPLTWLQKPRVGLFSVGL